MCTKKYTPLKKNLEQKFKIAKANQLNWKHARILTTEIIITLKLLNQKKSLKYGGKKIHKHRFPYIIYLAILQMN